MLYSRSVALGLDCHLVICGYHPIITNAETQKAAVPTDTKIGPQEQRTERVLN